MAEETTRRNENSARSHVNNSDTVPRANIDVLAQRLANIINEAHEDIDRVTELVHLPDQIQAIDEEGLISNSQSLALSLERARPTSRGLDPVTSLSQDLGTLSIDQSFVAETSSERARPAPQAFDPITNLSHDLGGLALDTEASHSENPVHRIITKNLTRHARQRRMSQYAVAPYVRSNRRSFQTAAQATNDLGISTPARRGCTYCDNPNPRLGIDNILREYLPPSRIPRRPFRCVRCKGNQVDLAPIVEDEEEAP
jgi:hypothetical protein